MTSILKIESNKTNASRSTGPRTPGGKLRSRHNARRHGLATRIEDDPAAKDGIACLTVILADGDDGFERIRAARCDVFLSVTDLEHASAEDFEVALRAMDSISRYATRAVSKRKRALRTTTSNNEHYYS